MSALAIGAVSLVVTALLCRSAFRAGRRRTRTLLPAAVVPELADHKLQCLREPANRVRLELAAWAGDDGTAR